MPKIKRQNCYGIWCAAGQSYKNSECKGEALHLNWEEAMAFAEEFSEKSGKQWRLPSKKELKSIMLDQCINPAVDVRVFKDLEVNNFGHQVIV